MGGYYGHTNFHDYFNFIIMHTTTANNVNGTAAERPTSNTSYLKAVECGASPTAQARAPRAGQLRGPLSTVLPS